MRFMIDSFTPEDGEQKVNERHKLIRTEITEPIKKEDDKLLTLVEIRDAIKGMNKNKAQAKTV